jgi:hypothetical protein
VASYWWPLVSASLLALLLRIQRQTREDVSACNADQRAEYGPHHGRPSYTVRDFYCPAELVWRNPAWIR